jgi:hypothetical protein
MANFKTQQIDIQSSSGTSIDVLPVSGHILPFAGPSNKIPSGWVLCDGTNGTPDLRGKIPGSKNASAGTTQNHQHTFTHTLAQFDNKGIGAHSTTISNANIGVNSVNHTHGNNAAYYVNAYGNTGPANRSNGTQSNVIGMNHTHSMAAVYSTSSNFGNQNSNHQHTYAAYTVNDTTTTTNHNHTISGALSANSQSVTNNSLPSIYYVNFIMKV